MDSTTATEFVKEGASVVVADVNRHAGERLASIMQSTGGTGLFVEADLSRSDDCRRVVEEAVVAFDGLDILFNNVGIQPSDSYSNVENTSEEMWDRILRIDLKSYFLMSKFAIPEMRRRGGGVIINNARCPGPTIYAPGAC